MLPNFISAVHCSSFVINKAMDAHRYSVLEITVLKKPRCDEARQLLDKVAKQVQPIMRKRRWTVKKLSEFSPRNPGLLGLNVNRGAEVKIRLRPARDEDSFYDWNHILGTMLHELCHIEIGPHNAAFYKLLDELWGEAEELMDKGITGTGQGFDAPSAGRLGSHAFIPLHNPPQHKMADAIRKAAEARAAQAALMPSGPRKLGSAGAGGIDYRSLTPAQAAAAAAERRARDNVWCGAEHSADEVEREVGQQVDNQTSQQQQQEGARVAAAAGGGAGACAGGSHQGADNLLHPTRAAQQQQQRQQQQASANDPNLPQQQEPQLLANNGHRQQTALQQQWQQHLQQQHSQRQQRAPRKRTAVEMVDLTLTGSDEEGVDATAATDVPDRAGPSSIGAAANASGPGINHSAADGQVVPWVTSSCPCCAAEVEGPLDAAVMQRLRGRQWCAFHRQLQIDQHQDDARWTCSVCTLLNPPSVLACEACLTVKNKV